MKITTNHHARPTIDGYLLPAAARARFDYLDWPAIEAGEESATFLRYRGEFYDLSEFQRVEPGGDLAAAGWEGVAADSAFSGVLVRLVEMNDGPGVVVGYCYS